MAVDMYQIADGDRVSDFFADREEQSQVFAEALAVHRARLDNDEVSLDPAAPRRNVIVYHGLGGIGKSRLSERLRAWMNDDAGEIHSWGPPPEVTKPAESANLDFAGTKGAFDVAGLLLDVRDKLGSTIDWSAFDLAFSVYWNVATQGAPLPEKNRGGAFDHAARDLLVDVLGSMNILLTPAGVALRTVEALTSHLKNKRVLQRNLSDCPPLADLLDSIPSDASQAQGVALSWLLSWQMERLPPTERPLVVVFIDTYEELTDDPECRSERLLNQLVHYTPYFLWVVTGRDALRWADPGRIQLLAEAGRATWPGLAQGSDEIPRQHLVEDLSADDSRWVLEQAIEKRHYRMCPGAVTAAVDASGGWPLYLDLVLQVAKNATKSGEDVTVEDVTGSFDQLVIRVFRDIPHDEQRALRAAALVPRFDVVSTAAAAQVDAGTIERATMRALTATDDHPVFPHRMHDKVREMTRGESGKEQGAWSNVDWQAAAGRYNESLRSRHDASRDPELRHALTVQALHLAAGEEVDTDWIVKAISDAPSLQLIARERPSVATTETGAHLVRFVSCWDEHRSKAERLALKRELADETTLVGQNAMRFLAYQVGGTEAIDILERLCEVAPTPLVRYQRALRTANVRRFADAIHLADELAEDDPNRAARLYGHVWQAEGRIADAVRVGEDYHRMLVDAGAFRTATEVECANLFRRSLLAPVANDELDAADDRASQQFSGSNIRLVLAARALSGAGDKDVVDGAIAEARARSSFPTLRWRDVLPILFDALVRQDASVVGQTHAAVLDTDRKGRMWVPIECLFNLADRPLPPCGIDTQWNDPPETVQAHWTALVEQRRTLIYGTR